MSQGELGLHPRLDALNTELLPAGRRVPCERFLDPGQGRSPPHGKRLRQECRGPRRRRVNESPTCGQQSLESFRVNLVAAQLEDVPTAAGDEQAGRLPASTRLDYPPKPGNGAMHHRDSRQRRITPQQRRQPAHGKRYTTIHQQGSQQRTLARRT